MSLWSLVCVDEDKKQKDFGFETDLTTIVVDVPTEIMMLAASTEHYIFCDFPREDACRCEV